MVWLVVAPWLRSSLVGVHRAEEPGPLELALCGVEWPLPEERQSHTQSEPHALMFLLEAAPLLP